MTDQYDLVIVGAGAAGLVAAVFAGRHSEGKRILLVDASEKPGRKLLVSGGGRCNITHRSVSPADYHGSKLNQIKKVLLSLSVDETVAFFTELGVKLSIENDGKLFPATNDARTVLNALTQTVVDCGVELITGHPIAEAGKTTSDGCFALSTISGQTIQSQRLILATGGLSMPQTGSDGSGFKLAGSLGHTITSCYPALVPLILADGHWLTGLSGISLPVALSIRSGRGKHIVATTGQMLLTHFGISGPVVLDISRHYNIAADADPDARLVANLLPLHDSHSLDTLLVTQAGHQPKTTVKSLLRKYLLKRIIDGLFQYETVPDPQTTLSHLAKYQRQQLVKSLTLLDLPVTGSRGFDHAEVTAGGVPLSELHLNSLESRICPGLHLCGEMLDVDGRLGGFNLQWAWCTGRLAGLAAVK